VEDDSNNLFVLWQRIEEILASQDPESGWLSVLPPLLLDWSDLSYAFITEMYPGVSANYFIRGAFPELSDLKPAHPLDAGLAGWVHAHLTPLAKDTLNTGENLTYIFSKPEPIKKPTSFYGWPLVYYRKPIGGFFLIGTKGKTLSSAQKQFFNALASRLSAHVHHMRLHDRVNELKGLDFQTGLPHRANFLERLERLMSLTSLQRKRLCLKIFCVSGLGRYSIAHSQEEAQAVLKDIASQLLHHATERWELGHVSYGLFTIAVPEENIPELAKCLSIIKKSVNEWSVAGRALGQASFIFHESEIWFPDDADKPEGLLEAALAAMAEAT
jgi:GGDEF domain-containing protein